MTLRIGMYHCTLPQRGKKPGGVSVFVHRLADALQERGHEVTVFAYEEPTVPFGYRVETIRPSCGASSAIVRLYLAAALLNVRPFDNRFDVAHLHGDDWFYLRRKVPTVRTFHGSALMEALTATSRRRRVNESFVFLLELFARERADAVYGVGPDSHALYRADGLLQCGVAIPTDVRIPADRPTILFVGTWEGRKRGRILHDVFRRVVRPQVPDAQLWLVSDRAEPGEGVTWFESPTDDALAELLRQAWVFCLPSSYEGLGIPYLEAMARGVPVVASYSPGAVDVLAGGEAGQIVADHELGTTLVRLLTQPALRTKYAAAGKRRVAAFTWEVILDHYEAAYSLAIERYRRGKGT